MTYLKRVVHYGVFRLPEVIVGILTMGLATLVNVQVFLRYVLHESLPGSDEYLRIMFVWVVFLGAAVATKRVAHLGLSIGANRLPQRALRYLDVVAYLVVSGVALVMIFKGSVLTDQSFANTFTMSGVPIGVQYSALPVSGALILVYALHNMMTGKAPIPESAEEIEKLEEL